MKSITIISFLLLLGSYGFGQENTIETKHKPIKLTQKEFFDSSIPIDTIIRQKFYNDGIVSQQEIIWRLYNKIFGDTLLWWLDRKFYRNTGQLKSHLIYKPDIVTETMYDKEDIITYKRTTKYEFKDPNKIIYKIGSRGGIKPVYHINEYIKYHKGRVRRIAKTNGYFKKIGVWEYYNKKTGVLEKTITYDMGKKVAVNKIE